MACSVSLLGFDGLQEDRDEVSLLLSGMVGTGRSYSLRSHSAMQIAVDARSWGRHLC